MKSLITLYLLLQTALSCAQDKLYLLNGTKITCTVSGILPEHIEYNTEKGKSNIISKFDVLMIAYHNNTFEQYNQPNEDININAENTDITNQKNNHTVQNPQSFLSINSIAITNADFALNYEYLSKNEKVGAGISGSYNFNIRVTALNIYFANLPNSKKNYDAGIFVNRYFGKKETQKMQYSLGLMMKYLDFTFDVVRIDSVNNAGAKTQVVNYSKTNAMQLATMATFGGKICFKNNFYVQFLSGIGGFNLRGKYREEFNKNMNKNLKPGEAYQSYTFLPKIILSLNTGFYF